MNKLNSLCSKANNLTAWKLLLKLKQSSLKEASEYFGLDNAQSSRIISSLEKELDYELLDRSHKPYRLNENFRILEKNLALMVEAHEKILKITQKEEAQTQWLTFSLPANMGRISILNSLLSLEKEIVDLRFMIFTDKTIEELEDGKVDIAILPYKPEKESVYARPLKRNWSFLTATPVYLKKHGIPKTVKELSRHRLLLRPPLRPQERTHLELKKGRTEAVLDIASSAFFADAISCRELMLDNFGIAVDLDGAFITRELSDGLAVPVLPGWHRDVWDNHICCSKNDSENPVIRLVMKRVEQNFYKSFTENWKFWYKQFKLENPEIY